MDGDVGYVSWKEELNPNNVRGLEIRMRGSNLGVAMILLDFSTVPTSGDLASRRGDNDDDELRAEKSAHEKACPLSGEEWCPRMRHYHGFILLSAAKYVRGKDVRISPSPKRRSRDLG